jgi:nucleotide-binding universal stress UspA family protein
MRILVATEGSKAAAAAVRFAARLAAATRGELVAVTVRGFSPRLFRARADFTEPLANRLEEAERQLARRALEMSRREGSRVGLRVRTEFLTPRVLELTAETIGRAARRLGVDLIIAGSRGGSPLTRWALGSMVNRLVHLSDRPVAVVRLRRGRSRRPTKIIVATDGSRAARAAVRFAARLAAAIPRGRLTILTVSTLAADVALTGEGFVRALGLLPELKQVDRRADARILAAAARQARSAKRVTFHHLRPGRRVFAADAIAAQARREGSDLIVVGRTGRSALGDVVAGSVAQRVLALASRPVALVPAARKKSRRKA